MKQTLVIAVVVILTFITATNVAATDMTGKFGLLIFPIYHYGLGLSDGLIYWINDDNAIGGSFGFAYTPTEKYLEYYVGISGQHSLLKADKYRITGIFGLEYRDEYVDRISCGIGVRGEYQLGSHFCFNTSVGLGAAKETMFSHYYSKTLITYKTYPILESFFRYYF